MQNELPTPHGDRLHALLNNAKLPNNDHARVLDAITVYKSWTRNLTHVQGEPISLIEQQVDLLNQYKRYIELELDVVQNLNHLLYTWRLQRMKETTNFLD
jgi:hypothetical protein